MVTRGRRFAPLPRTCVWKVQELAGESRRVSAGWSSPSHPPSCGDKYSGTIPFPSASAEEDPGFSFPRSWAGLTPGALGFLGLVCPSVSLAGTGFSSTTASGPGAALVREVLGTDLIGFPEQKAGGSRCCSQL